MFKVYTKKNDLGTQTRHDSAGLISLMHNTAHNVLNHKKIAIIYIYTDVAITANRII